MKNLILLAALVFAVSAHAQYQPPPGSIPGHDQIPPHFPDIPNSGHHGGGHTSCAPEVLEGNVAATSRTLNALARSSDFKDASAFRAKLAQISSAKSDSARMNRYLALIGIDANDSAAVAGFIGAREVRGTWLTSLEKSTGLSAAQADVVAQQLRNALRGSLQ